MAAHMPAGPLSNGALAFFREFLKHPLQIGSFIPSSRFLEQRVLGVSGIGAARTVVELGAGTGGTTRAILQAMAPQARLLTIEINPRFHRLVSGIEDPRLIAHLGSACDLEGILAQHELGAPDVVISGIPFSTMSPHLGSQVLAAISAQLAPSGRFVAYQWSNRVASLCRPYLGRERMALELLNIPPMRVYQWEKAVAEADAGRGG